MPKIICLNGPPQSGKDTTALIIAEYLTTKGEVCLIDKFAHPLDAIAKVTLGFNDDLYRVYREELKDAPLPGYPDRTMRQVLIAISEDYIKPLFGDDFFAIQAVNRIQNSSFADWIVFSDSGFQLEFDKLKELLQTEKDSWVRLMRLERGDGFNFDKDSREYVNDTSFVSVDNTKDIKHLKKIVHSRIDSFLN